MLALRLLREQAVLQGCDAKALALAAESADVHRFEAGERVVAEGARQTEVLFICRGSIELTRTSAEGRSVLVGAIEAPALFGDAELYGRSAWVVSATAAVDSLIVSMRNAAFDRLVAQDGALAMRLYRDACQRHLRAVRILQVLSLESVREQLIRLLWSLAKPPTEVGEAWTAPLQQVALASALGIDRKTIARTLKELENEGVVERRRARVALKMPPPIDDLGAKKPGAGWRLVRGSGGS